MTRRHIIDNYYTTITNNKHKDHHKQCNDNRPTPVPSIDGTEQFLPFLDGDDVRTGLVEFVRVILEDVPVSLQGVEEGRVLGGHAERVSELRHLVVDLRQLSKG